VRAISMLLLLMSTSVASLADDNAIYRVEVHKRGSCSDCGDLERRHLQLFAAVPIQQLRPGEKPRPRPANEVEFLTSEYMKRVDESFKAMSAAINDQFKNVMKDELVAQYERRIAELEQKVAQLEQRMDKPQLRQKQSTK